MLKPIIKKLNCVIAGLGCPHGAEYMECAPPCRATCRNPTPNPKCYTRRCRAGCYCPPPSVLHRGACIPVQECRKNKKRRRNRRKDHWGEIAGSAEGGAVAVPGLLLEVVVVVMVLARLLSAWDAIILAEMRLLETIWEGSVQKKVPETVPWHHGTST